MKNYCGKCGSKLNFETGMCPVCNKDLQTEKIEQVMIGKGKRREGFKIKLVVTLLLFCSVVGIFAYLKKEEWIDFINNAKENKVESVEEDEQEENIKYCMSMCKGVEENGRFYWREYEHDRNGKITKIIEYNEEGEILGWIEYIINSQGNSEKQERYNKQGNLSSTVEYEYGENDNVVKVEVYDNSENISWWIKYEYDEKENRIRETSLLYTNVGETTISTEHEYDEKNNLIKSTQYNSDGSIFKYKVYERDEEGRVKKISNYEGGASLAFEWEEYVYSDDEKKTTIYEYVTPQKLKGWRELVVEEEEDLKKKKVRTTTTRYHAEGTVEYSWWEEIEYVKIKVK